MSHTQAAAAAVQPTLINIPQPQSNPDTPSEMPGTPTSTTTSLSALSTTAIKDGQRGGGINNGSGSHGGPRGHQYHSSANSLEAERADRISRLTGLSTVSTLRATRGQGSRMGSAGRGGAPLATPPGSASSLSGGPGFALSAVPGPLTPAFFDAHGQPVAITKMSTVGTASATASRTNSVMSGHTLGTVDGDDDEEDDLMLMDEDDRMSSGLGDEGDDDDPVDDDDDGSASLVGFGEGAGSTISGPIYQRHHNLGFGLGRHAGSSAGAMAASTIWAEQQRQQRRLQQIQDDVFVDRAMASSPTSAATGPLPFASSSSVIQAHPSALRETQRPRSHQQQQQQQQQGLTRERVAAEQILRSLGRLDGHERSVSASSSTGQDHYQAYQLQQQQQQQQLQQPDPAHYHYSHRHANSGSTASSLASPSHRISRRSGRFISDERR